MLVGSTTLPHRFRVNALIVHRISGAHAVVQLVGGAPDRVVAVPMLFEYSDVYVLPTT